MAAFAAHVHGHVLDDAEDGHAHFFKHLDALARVEQGDVLRRGDDDGTGHGHTLAQGQLDVAGAGGHVHDQVVQVFPVGLAQQLLQRLGGHGAAPDHGFVLCHQEADGHDLHAVVFQRLHGFAVARLGAGVDAHHHRLAGAIDVGVEQAHAGPLGGQRQRQVHSGGAFAHATLARGHGDDVLDVGHQLHTALHRVGNDAGAEVDRHVVHPRHAFGRRHQRAAQGRDLALGGVTQLDVKSHVAATDLQVFQRAGADKVGAGVGVHHALQRGLDVLFCHSHGLYYS